jgi:hypothetical protein
MYIFFELEKRDFDGRKGPFGEDHRFTLTGKCHIGEEMWSRREYLPAKFNEVELDEVYRLIEADLRRREAEANGDFTQAQSG